MRTPTVRFNENGKNQEKPPCGPFMQKSSTSMVRDMVEGYVKPSSKQDPHDSQSSTESSKSKDGSSSQDLSQLIIDSNHPP